MDLMDKQHAAEAAHAGALMDKQQAAQAAQAEEALMDKQQAAEAAGARPLFTDGRCYVVRSKWRLLTRKMV